jgi:NADPH-dependent glutamate synthase beta subunit-like oxidoreductase
VNGGKEVVNAVADGKAAARKLTLLSSVVPDYRKM